MQNWKIGVCRCWKIEGLIKDMLDYGQEIASPAGEWRSLLNLLMNEYFDDFERGIDRQGAKICYCPACGRKICNLCEITIPRPKTF